LTLDLLVGNVTLAQISNHIIQGHIADVNKALMTEDGVGTALIKELVIGLDHGHVLIQANKGLKRKHPQQHSFSDGKIFALS